MIKTIPIAFKQSIPTPLRCKAFRGIFILLALLRIGLLITSLCGISLYFKAVSADILLFLLHLLIVLSALLSIHFKKQLFIKIISAAAAVVIAAIIATNTFSYIKDVSYREFTSPSGKATVVLRERGYLFSGETKFFLKCPPLFMQYTGESIAKDDGYQAIANAEITAKWQEEAVTFIYTDKETGEVILEKTITI